MRLLQLHSDFIEYEPISKEIKNAEDNISRSKTRLEDIVVAFIAIENGDDNKDVITAIQDLKKYLDTIQANRLLLYPYAHLSSDLAPAPTALELINFMEKNAKENIKEVYRAPFGWTKSFNIKVKGHPMAENSRSYTKQSSRPVPDHNNSGSLDLNISALSSTTTPSATSGSIGMPTASKEFLTPQNNEEKISSALKAEEKLQSFWYILDPNGELTPVKDYKYRKSQKNLEMLVNYEISKKRSVDEQPPHVRLMKKLALADYEPASDAGNMRFYPKGRLMKSLIEQYVTRKVQEYGGIEVETPIMYDSKHPSMESYFNRFPARQYNITSDNKNLFLRFAACFGQFLMAKDLQISYKHLPLKLYELTRYSFRREKSGEIVGLRRLRAFSMPDCHALCRNIEQAKLELLKRFDLSIGVLNNLGLSTHEDVEMAIRFTEDFYKDNRDFINNIANKFGRPVVVEIWKDRFFYFILKWEFNFIDNLGKASALSTDQIDVENGKRYEIEFVDEDGTKKNPIILHNSPSGAVERVIYALLEKMAKISKSGGTPSFPLWLSHTQVRLIPVAKQHVELSEMIAEKLTNKQIRADIDDRDESVAKKIRESETEWIRYTLVIGDKEMETGKFTVRDREQKKQREIEIQELVNEIKDQIQDKPYMPLNLPRHLSARPQIMV